MTARRTAGPDDKTMWLPAWKDDDPGRAPPSKIKPQPSGPHKHRRWPHYLMIGTIVFLVLAILATGSGYVYLRWRFSQIDKESITGLVEDGAVFNVLLVGSDSRENVAGDKAFDDRRNPVAGQRSDTMMILHADSRAKDKKAAILSIPRDLYLPIAGTGSSNRINTAFDGGPQRLIDTIQQNLGIKINHYVQVDFLGFQSIVNSVGGIDIYVPSPVRDKVSGLNIKTAGCAHLDGFQALAWSRSRNFEEFEGGRWQTDPTGDLGRIQRQQDFIRRMMKKALATRNPFKLNQLVGIGINNVKFDDEMSSKDVLSLAKNFRNLNPDTVDMLTLPTTAAGVRIGGQNASVLKLKQPEAQASIDRINGVAPPPGEGDAAALRPENIGVRVLNGSGVAGRAAEAATALHAIGFNTPSRGNAERSNYTQSVIRYGSGALPKAQLLQRYLVSGATLQADSTLRVVDVALVVGSDYAGVRDKPGPAPAPAPTTTVAGKPAPPPQPAC